MNKASLTKTALPNGGELYKYDNGDKVYFLNRKIHRENGPAVKDINGTKEWYLNGRWHRIDGPAIEYADGTFRWYLNGKRIPCTTQLQFKRLMKLKAFW